MPASLPQIGHENGFPASAVRVPASSESMASASDKNSSLSIGNRLSCSVEGRDEVVAVDVVAAVVAAVVVAVVGNNISRLMAGSVSNNSVPSRMLKSGNLKGHEP